MKSLTVQIAALYGFSAVALGAFGAHGLQKVLGENGTTAIWEKATLYHLVHSAVLLALALSAKPGAGWPFRLFAVGIIVFSGSLYALAVSNIRWLGAITPIGGLCLLGGWLWIAIRGLSAE
jgi:uncharacterized membrane protein YgdD (TMEM256/DUF423 family)